MAKKPISQFSCQQCGSIQTKWHGKCPDCGAWSSLVEEKAEAKLGFRKQVTTSSVSDLSPISAIGENSRFTDRITSGIRNFDEVLGGGIVSGSMTLLAGDPGIGKSTLLLQVTYGLAKRGLKVVYISGEESCEQIAMRARRLKMVSENLYVGNETNCEAVLNHLSQSKPTLLVIDSIQTIYDPTLSSAPGSVSQIRECASRILEHAKTFGVSVIMTGHVTKEGQVAGPRVLEHLVDCVLNLEGDHTSGYRIIRASKNRFGSTGEIAAFHMQENGLIPVEDLSQLFFSEHTDGSKRPSGVSNTITIEGSRPIAVEIQALNVKSFVGAPKRTSLGFDFNRLSVLLAVLDRRAGYHLLPEDVYVSVSGGLKLQDPGADLSVCAAMISSLVNKSITKKITFIGEVGLTGEIRPVAFIEKRLREAKRLGFEAIAIPRLNLRSDEKRIYDIANEGANKIKILPVHFIHEIQKLEIL